MIDVAAVRVESRVQKGFFSASRRRWARRCFFQYGAVVYVVSGAGGHFETHAVDDAFVLFVVTVFVLCI